jgi:hypothetical protein
MSARSFTDQSVIYVVISDVADGIITDHYTLSFACDDPLDDLYQTNLLLWRNIPCESEDARDFVNRIKRYIVRMGYFPIIETGLQVPLTSVLALDMSAAA